MAGVGIDAAAALDAGYSSEGGEGEGPIETGYGEGEEAGAVEIPALDVAATQPKDEGPPPPLRVFLTGVDSYWGKHAGKAISEALFYPFPEEFDGEGEGSYYDDVEEEGEDKAPPPVSHEVIGTLFKTDSQRPEWCKEIVPRDREAVLAAVEGCDVIVYDVLSDVEEAQWLVETLAEASEAWDKPKTFVSVSTVMTWAKTKPLEEDEDDDDPPGFMEDEYKRRKPHSNFKPHITVEKLTIKWGNHKKNFHTYVLAHGLLYGEGEDIFHFLFKSAWHGSPRMLPCIGGRNVLPTIHVRDMANALAHVVAERPEVRYIVAVDDSNHTAEEIVQCISENLGTGAVKRIKADDALLIRGITPVELDMLRLNLRINPGMVREFEMEWVSEFGLVEDIQRVIREYKTTRGLTALKLFITGPPASGKSFFASRIAREYKIHHIKTAEVIAEYEAAAKADEEREDEWDELVELKEERGGRYPDDIIVRMFKDKLHSMPCQNQGFILDGCPKSLDMATEMFELGEDDYVDEEEEEEGEFDANEAGLDKKITPEVCVVIEAADDFLKERVMNLPESEVAGTHNNEEDFKRRLVAYRRTNNEEEAVWDFFDMRETMPVMVQADEDVEAIMRSVRSAVGPPHNYGPTAEERAVKAAAKAEEEARLAAEEAQRRAEAERLESEARDKHTAEWEQRLAVVKEQERILLEQRALPLRQFLMDNVMPTLTNALIEVCKVRPDDPIDYLAEYLFRANPEEEGEIQ